MLSILCPSIRPFLDRVFLAQINTYAMRRQVEFLRIHDNGHMSTGMKQKWLYEMSTGDYVMFVADDDIISPRLLPLVLDCLKPGIDGVGFKVRLCPALSQGAISRVGINAPGVQHYDSTTLLFTWPWHPLCVTRRELLADMDWPDYSSREDAAQAEQMKPLMDYDKWTYLDEELYYAFMQENLR